MAHPAYDFISPDDYLQIEVRSNEKHEYFDGRIYAMSGASYDHNYIVSNLMRKVGYFLEEKGCDIFSSDLRVATPQSDSFMYPDITIVCGDMISKENGFDTLTNPTVIVEVMSPSTRGYDMAFKYHYYKQISSLKEYILIDSTRFFVQVNRRENDEWTASVVEDVKMDLSINAIGASIPLKDIYRKVSFFNEGK